MAPSSSTIAILGAGSVGSAIAQSLLLRRVVADLILVDIDHELCQAQVQDLSDATHLSNVRIRHGSHADAGQADIIILTAGAKQRIGDTRLDLIDRNLKVLQSVLQAMNPIRPDAILLLIANPVDALTYFAQKMSKLPRNQVLGSGTLLDSIRLRGILADKLEIAETAVNACVIGEHGDSQCVAWSTANVAGTPLSSLLKLDKNDHATIAEATKRKAYEIIKAKGFTSYGVAAATSSICEAIIFDQRQIFPLSHWLEDLQCCLSFPAVLGRSGIVSTVPLPLEEDESKMIAKSANYLKDIISQYEAGKA